MIREKSTMIRVFVSGHHGPDAIADAVCHSELMGKSVIAADLWYEEEELRYSKRYRPARSLGGLICMGWMHNFEFPETRGIIPWDDYGRGGTAGFSKTVASARENFDVRFIMQMMDV